MVKSQALWSDVLRDVEQAENAFAGASVRGRILVERGQDMDSLQREDREMAVGTFLHNGYCALEMALERLVRAVDGDLPIGRDSHTQLLDRASNPVAGLRPPIITMETASDLHVLRAFRHAMRHSYVAYDYAKAIPNLAITARAIRSFKREVGRFAMAMKIIDTIPPGFEE